MEVPERVLRPFRQAAARANGATLFFFQAEDGIRDTSVTGVQTCALPILRSLSRRPSVAGFGMTIMRKNILANRNLVQLFIISVCVFAPSLLSVLQLWL